jgi:uncharacterized protein YkwD
MRLVSWLGGILLVVVFGAAVGVVTFEHRQPALALATAASHQQTAGPTSTGPGKLHGVPGQLAVLRPSPSPVPVAAVPARVGIVVRSTQQALINGDRARNGLGSLSWSNCLYNVAIANARRIAAQGYLSHTTGPNQDLACGLGRQGGENVGWYSGGANDSWMNSAFMASPEHYANIMGPYHYVATAWVVTADGKGWIAVEFA